MRGNAKHVGFGLYPDEKEIRLSVGIDDREAYPDYENGYNRTFRLKPGINQVSIPLDTLVTSGTDMKLDLGDIYRVLMFVVRPERKVVLYVDYIRLV